MDFDKPISRIGTNSDKWDNLQKVYGCDPKDTIPMWVADMDFESPPAVSEALIKFAQRGVFGYAANQSRCSEAISGWMARRHNWTVDPDHIMYAQGLVNAVSMALLSFTEPGDEVVIFTPVYHAFARVIKANGRILKECPMVIREGRYELDFETYEKMISGKERMVISCSPHNPGGRIWERNELTALADFAQRHDLIVVSDEVHHDIKFGKEFLPMETTAPQIKDRLITLVAGSKIFNLAGGYLGNAVIADENLRAKWKRTRQALSYSPSVFSFNAIEAAYNTADEWVDALCFYLAENARIFDEGINAIPGLKSMKLEATYLAWVDFDGTGMGRDEFTRRVFESAKVAPSMGHTFGSGGESFHRFNIGTQRANVVEAVERLQRAFADLQ